MMVGSIALNSGVPNGVDSYLIKLNSSGYPIYAFALNTNGSSEGMSTAIDKAGTSVYIAGAFGGSFNTGNATSTSTGSIDWYVIKFDAPTGKAIWSQNFGGKPRIPSEAIAREGRKKKGR